MPCIDYLWPTGRCFEILWVGNRADEQYNQDFTIDIENNCFSSDEIPYQSKKQWLRQIRIEIEDSEGHVGYWVVSTKSGVLYSTGNPWIIPGNPVAQPATDITELDNGYPLLNKTGFTATITAVGATVYEWMSWDDNTVEFERDHPTWTDWFLWHVQTGNKWLQTRYDNTQH